MRINFKNLAQAGTALLLAAGMATISVAPAQALSWRIDPELVEQRDHVVFCTKLAFTNPARHTKLCGPSRPGAQVIPDESENPSVASPVTTTPAVVGKVCDGGCPQ